MITKVKTTALCLAVGMSALSVACTTPGSGPVNTNATAIGANRGGSASNANAATVASDTSPPSDDDRAFMMKAAAANLTEMDLGYLAAQKGAKPDVITFGKRMVDDHLRASEELKQLASQKAVTLPTEPDAKHKEKKDRLSKLNGDAFDKAYIAEMVKDHTEAISDFEKEADQGKNLDVKGWAAKMLPALRNHLQMALDAEAKLRGGKPANNNARR
jgi:putative membrane protein